MVGLDVNSKFFPSGFTTLTSLPELELPQSPPAYHTICSRPFLKPSRNTHLPIKSIIFHRLQIELDLKLKLFAWMSYFVVKRVILNFTVSTVPWIIKPCPGISGYFHHSWTSVDMELIMQHTNSSVKLIILVEHLQQFAEIFSSAEITYLPVAKLMQGLLSF